MHLAKVDFHPVEMERKWTFTTARGSRDTTFNLFCRLESDKGHVGWGGGCPSITTGDSPEKCKEEAIQAIRKLKGRNLQGLQETGVPFASPSGIVKLARELVGYGPTLNAAVDGALHDLWGQVQEQPLGELLAGGGPVRDEIPTSHTVPGRPVEKLEPLLKERWDRGLRILKIKLGLDSPRELEILPELLAKGPPTRYRFDPNQGYELSQAISLCQALAPWSSPTDGSSLVEYLEQPLKVGHVDEWRQLHGVTTLPLMLDEAISVPSDLEHYQDGTGKVFTDHVNIKLSKSGGLELGLELANKAQVMGLGCQLGCFGESRLSLAPALHMALAHPVVRFVDLDSHFNLKDDPVAGGVLVKEDGYTLYCADAPGLGVEVNL